MIEKISGRLLLALIASLTLSCSRTPVESESLSVDVHGSASLRLTVFGILTRGDSLQKIMIEDSRNNMLDYYGQNSYMRFSGTLSDHSKICDLNLSQVRILDPFQMPDVPSVLQGLDEKIEEARANEDPEGAERYMSYKIAAALGLTRATRWLTTDALDIEAGRDYRLDLNLVDSRFPDIETVIRDTTTVPGGFDITFPAPGAAVERSDRFRLSWTASPGAAGYRVIAVTPASEHKRFDTVVLPGDTSLDVPLFFNEAAPYEVRIWALDDNYFRFLSQRLEKQRVDRTHFFDYGDMNLSALVVFGSRIMRSVQFTVE